MHTELFSFPIGNQQITIYTYAFCIVLGTLLGTLYTKWRAKKELGIKNLSNNFFYIIFIAGFVGGKLFYYLERPIHFWNNPHLMLDNFSGGFVFYGSFVTIIPIVIWYLKHYKIPVLPILDIMAITTVIAHSLGRIGCFNAGCCYGSETTSFFGVTFPNSNNLTVHPTQLYEVSILISIALILLIIKKRQQFKGQLFILYVSMYAISRTIIELFRGDNRGYIIENWLSHSQFIAILILIIASLFYIKLKTKNKLILK